MAGQTFRAFPAKHPGTCGLCENPIHVGDSVMNSSVGVIHNGGCTGLRPGYERGERRPL